MGRKRIYDIDALAGVLYDGLADAPVACQHEVRGYDIHEIAKLLDIPIQRARQVIRKQRLLFGGDDEVNIPIHLCGTRRIYHLSAQVLSGQQWQAVRIKNELAQEEVNVAWWQSMVRANQHDQIQARYAAVVLRDHERLLEDLRTLL